jgi:hypothetical protein
MSDTLYADPINDARLREVVLIDFCHRCTERRKCAHDSRRVFRRRIHPHTEVAGAAWSSVQRERIRADEEIGRQRR